MKRWVVALVLVLLGGALLGLSAGDTAPNFSAKNQDGKLVRLSDFTGKPVLLFFYPKDDTPGCTREACSFRDEYSKFKAHGAVVLGVSRQDEESHREFRSKHKLPFDLLVDKDGKIGEEFGVKTMPIVGFLKRQSILIGANGKIIRFYDDVNPTEHASQVLKDLQTHATP